MGSPAYAEDGWFPLVVGVLVFTVRTTWFTGRRVLHRRVPRGQTPLSAFMEEPDVGGDLVRHVEL